MKRYVWKTSQLIYSILLTSKSHSLKEITNPLKNLTTYQIWYLTWLIFIDFIVWPPEVIDIWRSNAFRIIWGEKEVSEWNRNTRKPKIWYVTWLIFIYLIFWQFLEIMLKGRSNWRLNWRLDIYVYISAWLMWKTYENMSD